MSVLTLSILNLYPRELNIYGDVGNLQVLKKRAAWRNIAVQIINFEPTSRLDLLEDIDLILGGGGQDSGQAVVGADLPRIAPVLRELVEAHVPALAVCGSFQLFGKSLVTSEGNELKGIDIFDVHTTENKTRLTGNIVTQSKEFGTLIGYENHSGKTYLGTSIKPLATVLSGAGNNGEDATEGARYKNALGTYLHGPLLPKNPVVADFLLGAALEHRYGAEVDSAALLAPLPVDDLVEPAREIARNRQR